MCFWWTKLDPVSLHNFAEVGVVANCAMRLFWETIASLINEFRPSFPTQLPSRRCRGKLHHGTVWRRYYFFDRPFPHSALANKHKGTRFRVWWTISCKSLYSRASPKRPPLHNSLFFCPHSGHCREFRMYFVHVKPRVGAFVYRNAVKVYWQLLVCRWHHGRHVGGQEAFLSSENYNTFSNKFFEKSFTVLTTNIAALSRSCKPSIIKLRKNWVKICPSKMKW